ncbi:hypothetical protein F2P81_009710 [Scophthalmus maximus]|uniref:Uncharacterized protein n=1 Tax=Scophthalmus maximus TaxID=52904 RepID=A0A6A4SNX2_SCOMX|nr:hypothetical protein F2P81_009710 [Scophthalmus maximus]
MTLQFLSSTNETRRSDVFSLFVFFVVEPLVLISLSLEEEEEEEEETVIQIIRSSPRLAEGLIVITRAKIGGSRCFHGKEIMMRPRGVARLQLRHHNEEIRHRVCRRDRTVPRGVASSVDPLPKPHWGVF